MKQRTFFKLGIFIVLLALIIGVGVSFRDQLSTMAVQDTISQFGLWGPVVFVLIYIVATVLFLPGLIFTLSGGLIFGPFLGTLYNMIGAVMGATVAFLVSRYLASDWVAAKAGNRLQKLIHGVEQEGWKFVAVTRLVPLFPFNLLNYALGLTKIPLLPYVVASAIFMVPACFAYTYVGSLGQTVIKGGATEIVTQVSIAIGLLILISFIPYIIKKVRKNKADLVQLNGDNNE